MSAKPVTALAPTLTIRDVMAALGKSKRTVQTYVAQGRLPVSLVSGPNGKQGVYQREDVERLKHELDTPSFRAVAVREPAAHAAHAASAATAVTAADPQAFAVALAGALASALREALPPAAPPVRVKPWLTLKEAVDYSGLPASFLVQAARDGTVRAVNVGTGAKEFWRFNRAGLTK